jgi:hypothetical protein
MYAADVKKYDRTLDDVLGIINSTKMIGEDPAITTYENTAYRVKINHPSNWDDSESPASNSSRYSKIVTLFPVNFSLGTGKVRLPEGVTLQVDETPENTDLDKYLTQTIDSYNETLKEFQVIESKTYDKHLLLNNPNMPAYKLVYTYNDEVLLGKKWKLERGLEMIKYINHLLCKSN